MKIALCSEVSAVVELLSPPDEGLLRGKGTTIIFRTVAGASIAGIVMASARYSIMCCAEELLRDIIAITIMPVKR